jgi:hypothetical protein
MDKLAGMNVKDAISLFRQGNFKAIENNAAKGQVNKSLLTQVLAQLDPEEAIKFSNMLSASKQKNIQNNLPTARSLVTVQSKNVVDSLPLEDRAEALSLLPSAVRPSVKSLRKTTRPTNMKTGKGGVVKSRRVVPQYKSSPIPTKSESIVSPKVEPVIGTEAPKIVARTPTNSLINRVAGTIKLKNRTAYSPKAKRLIKPKSKSESIVSPKVEPVIGSSASGPAYSNGAYRSTKKAGEDKSGYNPYLIGAGVAALGGAGYLAHKYSQDRNKN